MTTTTTTVICKTCGDVDDMAFGADVECHVCGANDRANWSDWHHAASGGTHEWARRKTDDGRCRVCGFSERAHDAREEVV